MIEETDPSRTAAETNLQRIENPSGLVNQLGEPRQIGRYRVERVLGEGAFGCVYLAHDVELDRRVAIKVPRRELIHQPEDVTAYLAEARVVASLDHPNIVPVYDVGQTDDGLCFVVSKFIEGSDLAKRIKHDRPAVAEAVQLVATVAEALHHAHHRGLVHRDVKPANILLQGGPEEVNAPIPYLADFGLALKEENFGKGDSFTGTPAYMSPEQARGEGHRVNGRSDIFSLGVVFYEMLAGRRPFETRTIEELLEQIANVEPRPPRQIDDTIPTELERICLKALAKRASERYTTARDFADDLRHWVVAADTKAQTAAQGAPLHSSLPPSTDHGLRTTDSAVRIVPKGLRSFDVHDADFFLELLPGPRDRDGLPDTIRFWKTRIEERDADKTFAVGLLYGPSGCGKSSLVKAGLLPRLSAAVIAIYIEATADATETRLLRALRKGCPGLPPGLALSKSLAALRHGRGLAAGKKLLIVLDQFEQWLHARQGQQNTELAQALRQCDGECVQCIIMVRDDFWMAATRFFGNLDVNLVQGHNAAAVDLFGLLHARKVLTAFGQAFGMLPEKPTAFTADQQSFLDQAVAGLSEEGSVISVRLALFAEMVKNKPWTFATLKQLGGMQGVGVTFLEDTFAAPTASPQHRLHLQAAQAVLKALLPETGSAIKGNMRSREELLAASGYAGRPNAFEELLHILDADLRLITPTDAEGTSTEEAAAAAQSTEIPGPRTEYSISGGARPDECSEDAERTIFGTSSSLPSIPERRMPGTEYAASSGNGPKAECPDAERTLFGTSSSVAVVPEHQVPSPVSSQKYYQFTHDFLVPSLRSWLTRNQKETRRGRAELRLTDCAELWTSKPENRLLPAWWEWANIRLFTRKTDWTKSQRNMMRKAGRYHAVRGAVLAMALAVVTLVSLAINHRVIERSNADHAAGLVRQLLNADISQVAKTTEDMDSYRSWADPLLRDALHEAETQEDASKQLRASLALLGQDSSRFDYLYERLLKAEPDELLVIREALRGQENELVERLRKVVESSSDPEKRLRAACALAGCAASPNDEDNSCWQAAAPVVVNQLLAAVQKNPSHYSRLLELLRPTAGKLKNSFAEVFRNSGRGESDRALAANFLAEYVADQPDFLGELLLDAGANQFGPVYEKLKKNRERAAALLLTELDKKPAAAAATEAGESLAGRQANAAVALLGLDKAANVWPLLKHRPDPTVRSQLIYRFRLMGADPARLIARLHVEPDVEIRRALLLSLGEFEPNQLPAAEMKEWIAQVSRLYQDDPDAGIHGSAEWLLRRWQKDATIGQLTNAWLKDPKHREQKQARIKEDLAHYRDKAGPQWYVNSQGQTMAVFPGPTEFWMGSPKNEEGRSSDEALHKRRIGRSFALAATAVTVEQFQRFLEARPRTKRQFNAGGQAAEFLKRYSASPDCPMTVVSWFTAAEYCNWLSEQEGLDRKEWCYEPNASRAASYFASTAGLLGASGRQGPLLAAAVLLPGRSVEAVYFEGMKLSANYLQRTGYRLPTEAEWEYACRARSATRWHFGNSVELLGKYAHYNANSADHTWQVGRQKPNDLGLFDMHGNVYVWCTDKYVAEYPENQGATPIVDIEDKNDSIGVNTTDFRVTRGGSFFNHPVDLRCAYRNRLAPTGRIYNVGLRPARTVTAE